MKNDLHGIHEHQPQANSQKNYASQTDKPYHQVNGMAEF